MLLQTRLLQNKKSACWQSNVTWLRQRVRERNSKSKDFCKCDSNCTLPIRKQNNSKSIPQLFRQYRVFASYLALLFSLYSLLCMFRAKKTIADQISKI